jgi:hypothetical protein
MAMNAAISAVPASVFSVVLSAAVYPRLAQLFSDPNIERVPLLVSLEMVLLSQLALTLVTPHEAYQAEHRTGMDEVKMAAFVGIAVAPVLALFPFSDRAGTVPPHLGDSIARCQCRDECYLNTYTDRPGITASSHLTHSPGDAAHAHAVWFGSIASSIGGRLVTLCVGCGLMMVLPVCITLVAPGLNLIANGLPGISLPALTLLGSGNRLFLWQALLNGGLMLVAALVLSVIYIFYLNLGRWFAARS